MRGSPARPVGRSPRSHAPRAGCPAGADPGRRIQFCGAEDLATKLFEISQAMANDWQAFAKAVEQDASFLARRGSADSN